MIGIASKMTFVVFEILGIVSKSINLVDMLVQSQINEIIQ